MPRTTAEPRPVSRPVSDSASEKPMLIPAPTAVARPTNSAACEPDRRAAAKIHGAVDRELPGMATPTVYATLDLFVELGRARRIDTGTAALYDARLDPHQHAVCRRCGRVQDVDGRFSAGALIRAAQDAGF